MQIHVNPFARFSMMCVTFFAFGAGCATYHAFPLEPLAADFHHSAIRKGDVTVCMEVLDSAASERHFCRDLMKSGIQPIQFTIWNDSTEYVSLHRNQISIAGANAQSVAEQYHFNTAGRAAGYGVAGLFVWPLLVPAVVDGTGSAKANRQMDTDYAAKELKDQVIMPYGKANGVLFVPSTQISLNVSMTLIKKEKNEEMLFMWSDGVPVDGNERTQPAAGEG